MDLQKIKPVRNKQYLRWVAAQPCCSCGISDSTVVPHHLISVGQGCMGGRASDLRSMSLCVTCHAALHLEGEGVDQQYKWIVETLETAIKEEVEALAKLTI